MRSDDKPCLRWLAFPRLVSRSRSFPPNCNQAKKQRLLQSFIFISTITSWDYGYKFFLLYWHVVVSKLKLSIFCERKTPRIREMVTCVGTKKKFWVPISNRTSDLPIPRSDALPLMSHRDYGERGIRRSEVRFLMGTQKFSFSLARDKKKNILLYFFTELKTYHISYSNYKHDAIDVANPSSMQDACHMNFVIDFANRRVSVV